MTDDIDQVAEGEPGAHNPYCWYCDAETIPDENDADGALICPVHGDRWLPPDMIRMFEREKRLAAKLEQQERAKRRE